MTSGSLQVPVTGLWSTNACVHGNRCLTLSSDSATVEPPETSINNLTPCLPRHPYSGELERVDATFEIMLQVQPPGHARTA